MKPESRPCLEGIGIGLLDAADLAGMVDVLARGMRDNPLHIAALGPEPDRRERALARVFSDAATVLGWSPHMLVARTPDGTIVGACGMVPPGECRPSFQQQLRLLPGMVRIGPRSAGRVMRWASRWAKRDLDERHWHLGPLAVDAHLQGMGSAPDYCRSPAPKRTRRATACIWRPTRRSM